MSGSQELEKVVNNAFCGFWLIEVLNVENAGFFRGESVMKFLGFGGGRDMALTWPSKRALGGEFDFTEGFSGDGLLGPDAGGSKTMF